MKARLRLEAEIRKYDKQSKRRGRKAKKAKKKLRAARRELKALFKKLEAQKILAPQAGVVEKILVRPSRIYADQATLVQIKPAP